MLTKDKPVEPPLATPSGPATGRKARQILDAATRLFLEHGFEAVSMERVTAEAGVSKATLYAYFASKRDLFTGVVLQEAAEVNRTISQPLDAAADVETTLRAMARQLVDMFVGERLQQLMRATVGAVAQFPDLAEVVYAQGPGATNRRLAAYLADAAGREGYVIPDPDLAARQFLNLVCGDFEFGGLLYPDLRSPAEIAYIIEEALAMFRARYRPAGG